MAMKYYIDNSGAYIGGYDGANPPVGSFEVPSPPNNALMMWVGGEWVKSLSDAALEKVNLINSLRNQKIASDFTHDGNTFDADQSSQIAINHAISYGEIGNIPGSQMWEWTLADNVTTSLTWDEFRAMAIALFERADALHGEARVHKDAINSMVDVATIDAYDITTGWTV